jgi:hypothetical protein
VKSLCLRLLHKTNHSNHHRQLDDLRFILIPVELTNASTLRSTLCCNIIGCEQESILANITRGGGKIVAYPARRRSMTDCQQAQARGGCGRSRLHIVSQRWQATYCELSNRRAAWTAFSAACLSSDLRPSHLEPPSCALHMLQYLDTTDTAAPKESENSRESCHDLR